jgi:D-aspartate ligase
MSDLNTSVPVLVLGGRENALSIVRHLSSHGIKVSVSAPVNCWGLHSRHCARAFRIPAGTDSAAYWDDLLLSADRSLDGHMLMPCSDDAIEFVADNHEALAGRYVLDEGQPDMRRALLDKRATLEMAERVGVPAPKFWPVGRGDTLEGIEGEITFPVMVKPISSHRFAQIFNRKLFIIEDSFDELKQRVKDAQAHDLEVMIVEMIPGPDDLLSSYYTYMDKAGTRYFDYTKHIVRRYPVNRGMACFHATKWLPETAEMGKKFFDGVGFTGLANIEFKRDTRDGKLKLIEVNARFTAAEGLVVLSGMPIDLIVYRRLTGQGVPKITSYKQGLYYWYPISDFLAFVELWRGGKLGFWQWVRSVLAEKRADPLFQLDDLYPVVGAFEALVRKLARAKP